MAIREIITLPNPILRRKAHKVKEFDKELRELIDDMVETMRVAPGVGLAAPQIGISQRIVVIEYGDDEKEDAPKKLYKFVNPEITYDTDEMVLGVEGCLSVKDLVGEVERYDAVTVKAFNQFGKPVKVKAKGWLARIFQHEIDHLDGVLFPDKAESVWAPTENREEAEDVEDTGDEETSA